MDMDMDMDKDMDMDMDYDKDMDMDWDKDMDMDDDMMRGMRGMGGGHMIMGMLLMETIGSSLMTFRWAKDFSSYPVVGGTNWWEMANMVCNYGNLVSGAVGLLSGIAMMIMED